MDLKGILMSEKSQSQEAAYYESIYITFLRSQNYRKGEQSSGRQGDTWLYLDWRGGHTHAHMTKWHRTTLTLCTNVDSMVLILYYYWTPSRQNWTYLHKILAKWPASSTCLQPNNYNQERLVPKNGYRQDILESYAVYRIGFQESKRPRHTVFFKVWPTVTWDHVVNTLQSEVATATDPPATGHDVTYFKRVDSRKPEEKECHVGRKTSSSQIHHLCYRDVFTIRMCYRTRNSRTTVCDGCKKMMSSSVKFLASEYEIKPRTLLEPHLWISYHY